MGFKNQKIETRASGKTAGCRGINPADSVRICTERRKKWQKCGYIRILWKWQLGWQVFTNLKSATNACNTSWERGNELKRGTFLRMTVQPNPHFGRRNLPWGEGTNVPFLHGRFQTAPDLRCLNTSKRGLFKVLFVYNLGYRWRYLCR